jgi:hypothetical protein
MKMRWGGTSVACIADETQGVTDLDLVTISDGLAIQVGIIETGISDGVTHPNNLAATVCNTDPVSLPCGSSYHSSTTPSENIDAVMLPPASIPCHAERALNRAHPVSIYWKC